MQRQHTSFTHTHNTVRFIEREGIISCKQSMAAILCVQVVMSIDAFMFC